MLVIEPHYLEENLHSKHIMEDTKSDEAFETLSFSDLPLYGDQSFEEYWEEEEQDLSIESQGSSSISSSSEHDDYFEFFSQELLPSAATFPPENIIFCGKLIPSYKQPNTSQEEDPSLESMKQANIKKTGVYKWLNKQVDSKNRVVKRKYEKEYDDFPVQKMSILTSSSSGKARWYLLLFGISRFSTRVELSDIKIRQRSGRRHGSAASPPSPPFRFQNHHHEGGGGNRDSGLWGLIKVLSCSGNHHPNAMVVSSIGCERRSR
ncbi:hypothetical protein ABFS83_06G190700 [Erythranthe nasuta]